MSKATLVHDCPNCFAANQAFALRSGYEARGDNFFIDGQKEARPGNARSEFLTFSCNRCFSPVVVHILRFVSGHSWDEPVAIDKDYNNDFQAVLSVLPETPKRDGAPEHTPENVASSFGQAVRALHRGDYDVAGMGFGRALDIATKQLIRSIGPDNLDKVLRQSLQKRISWLHDQGRLTDELEQWAHIIRLERNDAAHEEDPFDPKQAQQLFEFTRVFFMYVFTIPAKIPHRQVEN